MHQRQKACQGNRLLAHLSDRELRRLQPHLSHVSLRNHQVLYEFQAPIEYVYFPLRSVLSALTVMRDGRAIEVGNIGSEGGAGLSVLAGSQWSPNRVIVQVADGALRMPANAIRREAQEEGPLRNLFLEYQASFFVQVSQSVACNGLHPILKRCCRWLLMTQDRIDCDQLPLTHEFLALMLGVRRAGITEVLQTLQSRGLLRCTRGKITILDRQRLEALSCECYQIVKEEYDRLLG